MMRISLHILPKPPFRLDYTVWALRRQPHNRIDQWDGKTYQRVFIVEDKPLLVEATQDGSAQGPRLSVYVSGRAIASEERTKRAVASLLKKVLGTFEDMQGFYQLARKHSKLNLLANSLIGLKPPRFPSVFEALVNAFACQQLSLNVGITLLNRLSETFGASINDSGDPIHAFPGPEELANAKASDIRKLGFSSNKARAITGLAHSVLVKEVNLGGLTGMTDSDAIDALREIMGVGRWTAEYVLLRGLRRLAVFPGDDVGAQNNLQRFFHLRGKPNYAAINRIMLRWKPYGGFVYFHFLLQKLRLKGYMQ
jgi:DNA-3-methyladenine glycosylase II